MIQYLAFAALGKVLLDHFAAYGESRWLYLAAAAALVAAVAYEMREAGCSVGRCTHADNREAAKVPQSGEAAMCAESRRVTWRVSYIISFAVFTTLNVVRLVPRENLAMLLATMTIVHGAARWGSSHTTGSACGAPSPSKGKKGGPLSDITPARAARFFSLTPESVPNLARLPKIRVPRAPRQTRT